MSQDTAQIRKVQDKEGTQFFPITHVDAVIDENGDAVSTLLAGKQATLVSGTNIKTINSQSLLGSGNIVIEGGGGGGSIDSIVMNGDAVTVTGGVADLGTVITQHQDISGKADKVSNSTNGNFAGLDANGNLTDSGHKHSDYQAALVSGTNIKTVNSTSLLGSGNVSVGTYSKPSDGIPKTDLASAVQTSLGKADTALQSYTETDPVFLASAASGISSSDISSWNGKQDAIDDLSDIRSGAALGATALQSYTETDPTVPSWAKASSKPSYTFSEIGTTPTTISGYGITDAKIASGTITLGSNTITPLTSFTETDPIFSASAAAGISSSDITNWNGKTDKVTSATSGNFAGLDSSGNLTDSGSKASDFLTSPTSDTTNTLSLVGVSSSVGYSSLLRDANVSVKGPSLSVSGDSNSSTASISLLGSSPSELHIQTTASNASGGVIQLGHNTQNGFKIASEFSGSASRQSLVFYSSNNTTSPYTPSWQEAMRISHDRSVTINGNTAYHSGNANKSDVDWACSTLSASGNIAASGNIGAGTSQMPERLSVIGNIAIGCNTRNASDGYILFGDYLGSSQRNGFKIASEYASSGSRQSLVFYSSNSTTGSYAPAWENAMTISYNSYIGMGTFSPSQKLSVSGNITATGTITPGSDSRIKSHQEEISKEQAISILEKLKPKSWIWNEKSNEKLSGKMAAGLVAQDVKEIFPDAVTISENGDIKDFHSLNYNTIQGYEIAAIKGLLEEVRELKAEIAELKKQIK